MSIYHVFLRYVNPDGSEVFCSVYQRDANHQDDFQGELDECLYKQVRNGFDVRYVKL